MTLETPKGEVTKKRILREITRLYDPLGWLSLTIITAKIISQKLWIHGLGWDQPVDEKTLSTWREWREQLPLLKNLKIPRCP